MEENTATLTVTDLAVLKNCIDIACSRGAFRAPEMKSVGEIYDKLTAFLEVVLSQAEDPNQAPTPVNPQGETND